MNRETPTCLYFSHQESLCIWDDDIVLDALESQLTADNASFTRHPKGVGTLGHLDIFAQHEDNAKKFRSQYQDIRGTV